MLRLESIDTNIILRLILCDYEDLYERAKNLIYSSRCIFYVPDQVIIETVFQLTHKKHYNFPRKEAVTRLKEVLSLSRLDHDEKTFDRIFNLYLAHPKLSIIDCYLAIKMEDLKRTPLWTFDTKLANQLPSTKLA